jgi:hypothetical protein
VALRLDAAELDRKIVALRAQASQTIALFAALGEDRVRQWWSVETFIAAEAARATGWGTWRRGRHCRCCSAGTGNCWPSNAGRRCERRRARHSGTRGERVVPAL